MLLRQEANEGKKEGKRLGVDRLTELRREKQNKKIAVAQCERMEDGLLHAL